MLLMRLEKENNYEKIKIFSTNESAADNSAANDLTKEIEKWQIKLIEELEKNNKTFSILSTNITSNNYGWMVSIMYVEYEKPKETTQNT